MLPPNQIWAHIQLLLVQKLCLHTFAGKLLLISTISRAQRLYLCINLVIGGKHGQLTVRPTYRTQRYHRADRRLWPCFLAPTWRARCTAPIPYSSRTACRDMLISAHRDFRGNSLRRCGAIVARMRPLCQNCGKTSTFYVISLHFWQNGRTIAPQRLTRSVPNSHMSQICMPRQAVREE